MGRLIPDDFELSSIQQSERRVLEALIAGTDSGWLLLPQVLFVDGGRDGEADVVALHAAYGAVVLEVKGGSITARDGAWFQNERRLAKSPTEQAVRAKYALLEKVRQVADADDAGVLWFTHAVAFPDAGSVPDEWLGPDLEPRMILTAQELAWPDRALEALLDRRPRPASPIVMRSILRALRPKLEFGTDLGPHLKISSRRLDEHTEDVLHTAEGLDANLRVQVEGPAGSGKSRLAIHWARRASARGERVLLMCFNAPMGAIFALAFEDDDNVTAGNFHQTALRLLESTGFAVPENPSKEFWDDEIATALLDRRAALGAGFDTIIVDEVQDIRPHWFPAIEDLLDPNGAGRLYRLGDPSQNVYRVEAEGSDGWVKFPLTTNCRNTKAIAAVAQRLGGGETFPTSPEGPPVHFVPVKAVKELRKRLGNELLTLRREHGIAPSDIAVITTRASLRDEILDPPLAAAPLVRWQDRDEGSVVCETAHRLKGTEWQAVIVASLEPVTSSWLPEVLYVGVSRATTLLSVIAPAETGALLGLTAD